MRREIIPAALILVLIFAGQPAQADWSISFSGGHRSPHYNSYQLGDRITSEYRRGYQIDDWVERGGSSVTDSPIFADGIRLAAWTTRYENDYDFALASGIYSFELPRRARSIKIKISYDGEADRNAFNDDIAARVWIRRARIGDDYEEYYPNEGRYEDVDEPLYGDTFVLRSRKSYETIRLSADDYDIDGTMELHIVVEGRQRIDVKYIEVETYTSSPNYRVITKYRGDYEWQPWYNYTYSYFYTGPVYHFGDYYYVRYTYPRYRYHYVGIRRQYNSYLHTYYIKRPERRVYWSHVVHAPRNVHRTWDRRQLSKWTPDHEETRKRYVISSTKQRKPIEVRQSRTRIRSVLSSHSRPSPTATRTRATITVETSRTKPAASRTSSVRARSSTNRAASSSRSPVRAETQSSTRKQRDVRSSVRTRTSQSSQSSDVKRSPTRSTSSVRRSPTKSATQEAERSKVQRGSTKSRSTKSGSSSTVRKAPSRSSSQKKSSSKKVEIKKKDDDDDDDDDDDKKSSSSTSSSGSSSRKTVRRRTR